MTRIFYESMIKDSFPELQWLRVCTTEAYTATVYACDANLHLTERTRRKLHGFLQANGMVSCTYKVKHYFDMQKDLVFPAGELPSAVRVIAQKGYVTAKGVRMGIELAFPNIDPNSITVDKNAVLFTLKSGASLPPGASGQLELLLGEILPVGSVAKVTGA
ncbi:MAG: hypothetical protein FWH06_01130 [Oscillospiraceae bacterium]|nr:hypothetical protein [Oscillospiraceae bacterium]